MELHINKDTQLCMSLAGRPGNFGTRFHNFLYRELGLNFIYKAFTTRDIASAIAGIRALGIRGCAVSMPFKEACIQYLGVRLANSLGKKTITGAEVIAFQAVEQFVHHTGVRPNTDQIARAAAFARS